MSQQQGNYYLQLNILSYAMMGGIFLFALVASYLQTSGQMVANEELANTLVPVCIAVAIGGGVAADFLFRKNAANLHANQPLETRMNGFRSATILHLALLEGPALLGVVTYLVTGASMGLIVAIVLLGWMTLNRPSVARMVKHMHLSEEEQRDLFG